MRSRRGWEQTWRLQARRPTGYVLVTSTAYPDAASVSRARDFLGSLSALARGPSIKGPLRDTTSAADRERDCHTPAACRHFPDPDTREPDPHDRGYSPPVL